MALCTTSTGFIPRLARRARPGAPFGDPGFASSTASITLSPGLICVLARGEDPAGAPATHQHVGAAGLTVHQAWNAAAAHRLATSDAISGNALRFWVRDARATLGPDAPPGVEVRGDAASWLAHPRLFAPLDAHFTHVLRPQHGLAYLTRDCRDLFVVDAADADLRRLLDLPTVPPAAVCTRYSLGFPLLAAPVAPQLTRVA
ncbi:hypothetical protein [Corynebacterium timonense]|uniref:Uncharacterized protein n=1 Tax=Corynebacterium timonense TaxID=441500 RepID=A0A1H1MRL1_9CORY|nr:hypothetical protein [Corynebacterium timonense]SDR89262.1 hypothetical protein SAMN04488539_0590 [Corynebacterium timonense]